MFDTRARIVPPPHPLPCGRPLAVLPCRSFIVRPSKPAEAQWTDEQTNTTKPQKSARQAQNTATQPHIRTDNHTKSALRPIFNP
ncbi:MAG: hypothetical protein IJQ11_09790 [Bacteroidales bacterium]|nr:hypothetical protein [Bacteroidales bacterium]